MGSFAMCFGLDTNENQPNPISIASAHLAVNETGKVGLLIWGGNARNGNGSLQKEGGQRKGEGESFWGRRMDGREDAKEELCDEGGDSICVFIGLLVI